MSPSIKKYYPLLVIIPLFFLPSCALNDLTIRVMEPAPVSVPAYIAKVGIVNRSLPTEKNNQVLDKVDKVLSLEGLNLDKEGADVTVRALMNELSRNDRFVQVKEIDNPRIKSPGLGVFPAPLHWDTVKRICEENEVDALFVLSLYDTDANINYQTIPVELDGPLGVKIPAVEHSATINTLIKTGWRIYDPRSQLVLDELMITRSHVSSGRGINPVMAAGAVVGRKEAVLSISGNIGSAYATRILPFYNRVHREYYVRGTPNFRIGMRLARVGEWNEAAEFWQKDLKNPRRRIAGRAHYNMAIINEINGNLEAAINFASRAYSIYRNREALSYQRVLRNRLARYQQLQLQLNY
jgi:hypothetical protein